MKHIEITVSITHDDNNIVVTKKATRVNKIEDIQNIITQMILDQHKPKTEDYVSEEN